MMTKTLLLTAAIAAGTGATARASDGTSHTPDQILTDHSREARKLLAEARAARAAIDRDEATVARDIVGDALAIQASLGARPYALLESGTGTVERITTADHAPVVKAYDQFSEQVLLDLKATRTDLEQAKTALAEGKLSDARKALAKIEYAFSIEDKLTPDLQKLAAENFRLGFGKLTAGAWHDAKVEIQTALHDEELAAGAAKGAIAHSSPSPH